MELEKTLLYEKFNRFYERGAQAVKNNKPEEAHKALLIAAESLFKLAKLSSGDLSNKWYERANRIYEKAMALVDHKGSEGKSDGPQKQRLRDLEDTETRFKPEQDISNTTFDDVVGLEDVKRYIRLNLINPFDNPEVYTLFSKKAGGGALLYGPPGTGKTMIAKAIANEVNAPFYSVKASDIMSKWVGESERNIKNLFEAVRSHKACVLFIDEIESLTTRRGSHNSSVLDRVVSEFLAQIDGFNNTTDSVVMLIAATNVPTKIDDAMLRPGRFDNLVYVPLPNAEAREMMLQKQCANIPIESIDFKDIAIKTENYSGADLAGLVDYVKSYAIERTLDTGEVSKITPEDFDQALSERKPSTTKRAIQEYMSFRESREL